MAKKALEKRLKVHKDLDLCIINSEIRIFPLLAKEGIQGRLWCPLPCIVVALFMGLLSKPPDESGNYKPAPHLYPPLSKGRSI
jgi:hypothetical protein